jgi:hypothetical protein
LGSPGSANDSYQYNYFTYFCIASIPLLAWGALFPLVKSPATAALILKTIGAVILIGLLSLLLLSKRLKNNKPLRLILNETWKDIKLLLLCLIPSVVLYCLIYFYIFSIKKLNQFGL